MFLSNKHWSVILWRQLLLPWSELERVISMIANTIVLLLLVLAARVQTCFPLTSLAHDYSPPMSMCPLLSSTLLSSRLLSSSNLLSCLHQSPFLFSPLSSPHHLFCSVFSSHPLLLSSIIQLNSFLSASHGLFIIAYCVIIVIIV